LKADDVLTQTEMRFIAVQVAQGMYDKIAFRNPSADWSGPDNMTVIGICSAKSNKKEVNHFFWVGNP
jgi:hypothetical protein